VRPTVFYRCNRDELAFFVKDACEYKLGFASNWVTVGNLDFVGSGNFDCGQGRQEPLYFNQIVARYPVQGRPIFAAEFAGARTAQGCQVRSTAQSAP